jgi:hypothetical protein
VLGAIIDRVWAAQKGDILMKSRRIRLLCAFAILSIAYSAAQELVFRPSTHIERVCSGDGPTCYDIPQFVGNLSAMPDILKWPAACKSNNATCAASLADKNNSFTVYTDAQVNKIIGDLKQQIDTMQGNIKTLSKQNDALTNRVNDLERKLSK